MGVVMNVDKPMKRCTLHRVDCVHAKMEETPFKGINGEEQRDGMWLELQSADDARKYQQERYPDYTFHTCLFCRPS